MICNISQSQSHEDDIDLFGNVDLHHAACPPHSFLSSVSAEKDHLEEFKKVLKNHPDDVKTKNQFGKIPLHYALDSIHPSIEIVSLLVQAYPHGVTELDSDELTPCMYIFNFL